MYGTASLIYLLAANEQEASPKKQRIYKGDYTIDQGGIIHGDSTRKELSIVFTGDEFNDGGNLFIKHCKNIKHPHHFS